MNAKTEKAKHRPVSGTVLNRVERIHKYRESGMKKGPAVAQAVEDEGLRDVKRPEKQYAEHACLLATVEGYHDPKILTSPLVSPLGGLLKNQDYDGAYKELNTDISELKRSQKQLLRDIRAMELRCRKLDAITEVFGIDTRVLTIELRGLIYDMLNLCDDKTARQMFSNLTLAELHKEKYPEKTNLDR